MTLTTPHRRLLESAVKQARRIATGGAGKSLQALAVHEADPYKHMDEAQRALRRKLRAQAKQLGDGESHAKRGSYEIKHLIEKLAYDQWHRILFARYLLENDLLISPEHGVGVSLDDCEELAASLGLKDAWAVAARFAAVELPEIFRADDPAGAVELPVEDRKPLIALVTGLPVEVFTAGDSLGWCYQFWQSDQKETVNKSGNKIGADELPSVTQLFTEDYMVDFLLDNTLGAWHAARCAAVSSFQFSVSSCQTEEDARKACALPGQEWKYLRFVKDEPMEESEAPSSLKTENLKLETRWRPAAGDFQGWPTTASELRCLDPCMGSGHFVVAMFERLVALRVAEESLDDATAVAAVIRDNLYGLEIDPRCTQIAAFNLALAAWRRVGHCKLPAMNLACSGLAPNASKDDWLALTALLHGDSPLAGERDLLGTQGEPMLFDARLAAGMSQLYDLFQKAPVLGSLINPRAAEGDLLIAPFADLQPLLEKALAQETKDDTAHEMAVTARGLAKAAEILAGQFTLVATNYPFLLAGKQEPALKAHTETHYPDSKNDLATCFLLRSQAFLKEGGTQTVVIPHAWLFMSPTYVSLRENLLMSVGWNILAWLGSRAFETISGEVVQVVLVSLSKRKPVTGSMFLGLDARDEKNAVSKSALIKNDPGMQVDQLDQLANPEYRVVLGKAIGNQLLGKHADSYIGLQTGDNPKFVQESWEGFVDNAVWKFFQCPVSERAHYGGRQCRLRWDNGSGDLSLFGQIKGTAAWDSKGIAVRLMSDLPPTLYDGAIFEQSSAVLVPKQKETYAAIWCFCFSSEFKKEVRRIDKAIKITNKTFEKIAFDLAYWQKVAAEKYPNGLPKPFSSDPTQWLFDGHPSGADQPLHVAVARLLGYQWPRQTGSSFPDCPALEPDGLEARADEDGIVCLSATKGEAPAAERLRALLAQAMGKLDLPTLIASAGIKGSKSETLDDWLRDEFFEQHCAIFGNRPFIWHLWDGHKSGFSALVNYHNLTHATLENLTYAYLGDWIRRQQAAVEAGESGSDARLQAAKNLQARLKLILEGEPPYDIFVRWKPLSKQAIGWHPDLNDGVRMNIRPFMKAFITMAAPTKKNPDKTKQISILRKVPNIKWDKDRGKEPHRDKAEFPWFWKGSTFTGDRINDVHLTREQKEEAHR